MTLSRRQALAGSSLALLTASLARAEEPAKPAENHLFDEWTKQSERAVTRGTEWVLKTMHRDGGCGVDIGQPPDIGCTAMVGLALLSMGNTPVEGPAQPRSALDCELFATRGGNHAERRHHLASADTATK